MTENFRAASEARTRRAQERRATVVRLHREGMSDHDIAATVGYGLESVRRFLIASGDRPNGLERNWEPANEANRRRRRERHEAVLDLHRQRVSDSEIARRTGYAVEGVHRVLVINGARPYGPRHKIVTEDEVAAARAILEDGGTYGEVCNTLGHDHAFWRNRLPGYPVLSKKEASQRAVMMKRLNRIGKK